MRADVSRELQLFGRICLTVAVNFMYQTASLAVATNAFTTFTIFHFLPSDTHNTNNSRIFVGTSDQKWL